MESGHAQSASPVTLSRRSFVLEIVTSAVCGFACITTSEPLRWAAAILLIGYLPGRGVRVALRYDLFDGAANWVIDVALSLCCAVVSGLALNGTNPGVDGSTTLATLVAISVLGPVIALGRAREADTPTLRINWRSFAAKILVPVGIFVILATSALVIEVRSANSAASRVRTTTLSMVSGQSGDVVVTVTNWQHSEQSYQLVISAANKPIQTTPLLVGSGRSHVTFVTTSEFRPGEQLSANLSYNDDGARLRRVWFTVPDATPDRSAARP